MEMPVDGLMPNGAPVPPGSEAAMEAIPDDASRWWIAPDRKNIFFQRGDEEDVRRLIHPAAEVLGYSLGDDVPEWVAATVSG